MRLRRFITENDIVQIGLNIDEPQISLKYSDKETKENIYSIKKAISGLKKEKLDPKVRDAKFRDLMDKLEKWQNLDKSTKPAGPNIPPEGEEDGKKVDNEKEPSEKKEPKDNKEADKAEEKNKKDIEINKKQKEVKSEKNKKEAEMERSKQQAETEKNKKEAESERTKRQSEIEKRQKDMETQKKEREAEAEKRKKERQ